MAAKKKQKKAKDQPAKDIAKAEKQKKNDELSEEQLDKVAGGRSSELRTCGPMRLGLAGGVRVGLAR